MDDRERFKIHREAHGRVLYVSIPGHFPGNPFTRRIRWTREPVLPQRERILQAAAPIEASLRAQGLLNNLPQKIIPGYTHSYAYDWNFAYSYGISTDFNHLVYIRNDVNYNMKHMLWFPLRQVLRNNIRQYRAICVELPVFPRIVLEEDCQRWYDSNQGRLVNYKKGVINEKSIHYRAS